LVVIYYACRLFDQWRANLARKKVINAIDDETEGWETDPDDPEWERIGALLLENPPTRSEKLWNRRLKLRFPEAIVVKRMTDVLREMEMSRFFPVSEPDIFPPHGVGSNKLNMYRKIPVYMYS
jgi:hypothetical protein